MGGVLLVALHSERERVSISFNARVEHVEPIDPADDAFTRGTTGVCVNCDHQESDAEVTTGGQQQAAAAHAEL